MPGNEQPTEWDWRVPSIASYRSAGDFTQGARHERQGARDGGWDGDGTQETREEE